MDFNGVDLCLGCGGTFFAEQEPTTEGLMAHEIVQKVGRMTLLSHVKRNRRVRNRNCPKCGGNLKPIRKSVSGNIEAITSKILQTKEGVSE